jgi:enoyl-CoA hydratase/carnithine racemase
VFTGNKLSWEIKDDIGFIMLTDPPENRMNSEFFAELNHLVNKMIPESKASAIIIAGSGRHFSSGAELDDLFKAVEQKNSEILIENYALLRKLSELTIPVIASIRGVCIGAALELALHCHNYDVLL